MNVSRWVRKKLGLSEKTIHQRYPQYEIGKGTYGMPRVRSLGGASLKIGSYCSISKGVTIMLGGEHRTDWVTTYPFYAFWESAKHIASRPKTKGDVVIGSDVWIGIEAMILSGVRIGDGAVIGARSVVAHDVPPYAIAAGNPARVIRMRFPEDIVRRLLALRWWDWDVPTVERFLPLLVSNNVLQFLDTAEKEGMALATIK